MIPAGYMAKIIAECPDWLGVDDVVDIFSVSGCVSPFFTNYIEDWRHNGFWLFDSIAIIEQLALEKTIDLKAAKIFYYEVYDKEFDEDRNEESLITADPYSPPMSKCRKQEPLKGSMS